MVDYLFLLFLSSDDEYGGIPKEVFCLRNLRTLALGGQLIHRVPDKVSKLRRLQHLLLFYNPNLQGVSAQLGKANVIQSMCIIQYNNDDMLILS